MALEIRQPDFNWENMLKWWDGGGSPVSEEEDLENFMKHGDAVPYIYDVVDRVHDIAPFFYINKDCDPDESITYTEEFEASFYDINKDSDPDEDITYTEEYEVELFEASLDELQGLCEYIDYVAKALHEVDGLAPLFDKVVCHKYASVRAKAVEVVTTMVKNNPRSQQLVMEVNGLESLLCNFTSDPDVTARTKALGAISSLIRDNKPGITAFLVGNGYVALRDALSSESVDLQREALNLIQYLLHENSSEEDCKIVTQLGFPCIMMNLTSSDDAQVREAALRVLLVLARDEDGNSVWLAKNDDNLKRVLHERIEGISAMAPDAAREERQLVDSLLECLL